MRTLNLLLPIYRYSTLTTILILLLPGCRPEKRSAVPVSGSIDYSGSAELYIEKKPVHYKYAEDIHFPISPGNNGRFTVHIPADSTEVVFFHIDDESYPVVLNPSFTLSMRVERSRFPDSVHISGYPEPWNSKYISYRGKERPIMDQIDELLPAFHEGKAPGVINLYEKRYKIAGEILRDTPLDIYYHKAIGEYLVKRLEAIEDRWGRTGYNPDEERQQVVEKAKELDFFTFESLYAQRAGIRDFTNAFANTFGVEQRLERKYGQDLMEYDVKRLGYETMDSARTSVLKYINGRRALAYSKMHLIAERIGEMSPETAAPSYQAFLEQYDDFPRYTNFLKSFYEEVEMVTPGNPAVPFTLPNENGEKVSMSDFRGKYVLLDFWASWCIPCLDEFSHMRGLYKKYSRDQFDIVAISIEEDSLRWRQALEKFQNPWPQLYGGNSFEQETFEAYRGGGIPFYILVNPEGNIERYNDVRPSFNLPALLDSLITE